MKLMMIGLILAASFMLTSKQLMAVEVLTTAELVSHCDAYPNVSDGVDDQFCARYIQGLSIAQSLLTLA